MGTRTCATGRTSAASSSSAEGVPPHGDRCGAAPSGSGDRLAGAGDRARFRLDRGVRHLVGGRVLTGGDPFVILRLSEAGARALEQGEPSVMRVLARRGLAHPIAPREAPGPSRPGPPQHGETDPSPTHPTVQIIVPVHDDERRLARLEAALTPEERRRLIIVDDCSSTPLRQASIRLPRRRGPAAARNAARRLLQPATDLVCFLDSDTVPTPSFAARLAAHFDDARVGAVAPRVSVGPGASGWVARYEAGNSPLDMGERPGLVGAGRRISYVPTAALVCRRQALDDVGWFDEELTVGEDVDLVRRLEARGWDTRYEPSVLVHHDSRTSIGGFVRQRFSYGTSAALLDERHRGSVAPLRLSPLVAAAVAGLLTAAAAGSRRARWAGGAGLAAAAAATGRRARSELLRLGASRPEAQREALRLTAASTGHGLQGLFVALRRVWSPLAAVVLTAPGLPKPLKARFGALLLVAQLSRRPWPTSLPGALLGLVDDSAYGLGVWWGCLSQRSAGPLLPRLGRVRRVRSDPRGNRGSPAAPSREPSSEAPRL